MSAVTNKTAAGSLWKDSVRDYFKELIKKPQPTQPTLRKKSVVEKYSYIVFVATAFLIPFLLMFFAFRFAGVSPYGDRQILVTDLWHQYYPFLVDYHDKLTSGESLLWSWTSGGGTNYIALIAYYLASPLNFFSVLVPADKLREFLFVITCIKIGLAGMFYSLFIRISFGRKDISITAFGIMYALCAFIMGYYWNVIWLDSIALLPLVAAGTFSLLKKGKFKLYIISLALSILANYYIGLFVCAFVLLISVGYSIVEWTGFKQVVKNFFKMAGCSLVGIMMTAILTLPAYFALGHAYSSSNSFPDKFAVNIGSTPDFAGVLEGVSKTISNSVAFVQPTTKEGLPNVYTGVITIFLAILFLFCSKIKLRERIFCFLLQIFFLVSFVIRQLDYIWHGFHFPNMLPYRFSFLYSFVLIYMAFRVFMYIDHVKLASVIAAVGGFLLYLYVAGIYFNTGEGVSTVKLSSVFKEVEEGQPKIDPIMLSGWIGMILAAWILLYVLREQLPRLVITVGVIGVSITTLVFILNVYKKLNKSYFRDIENTEAVGGTPAKTTGGAFPTVLTWVFVIMIIAATVLLLSRLNKNNVILKAFLSIILVLMALFEGIFSAVTGVRTVTTTEAKSYPLGTTSAAQCVDYINEQEENNVDLARTEVTHNHTLNDDALDGFYGVSMFNSMVNMPITNYMEEFGLHGWIESNRYYYNQNSPFTDMMLNIKYLIDPYYGAYLDKTHYDRVYTADPAVDAKGNQQGLPAFVMKNRYYLPMGFMVNEDLLNYKTSDSVTFINNVATTEYTPASYVASNDAVDNQNQFFRFATGLEHDLYDILEITKLDDSSGTITAIGDNKFSYSGNNSAGTYKFSAVAPRDGTALMWIEGSGVTDNKGYINDTEIPHYGTKRPMIMMIGDVKAGDTITAGAGVESSQNGTITCKIMLLNEEMFKKAYQMFSRSTLNADTVSATKISGTIDVAEDGLFYTSIPYVDGWRAYVDGEEVEITPVGGAMLAFKLGKGNHTIELKYTPEGFVGGIVVSVAGLLIFILMILAVWQKKRLLPIWQRITAPVSKKFSSMTSKLKKPTPASKTPSEPDESAQTAEDPSAAETVRITDEEAAPTDDGEETVIADDDAPKEE